jgi:hypothetical protein
MQAGWYADPMGMAPHRWFDGQSWTTAVLDAQGNARLESAAPPEPAGWPPYPTAVAHAPMPTSVQREPHAWPPKAAGWGYAHPAAAPVPGQTGVAGLAWLWTVLGVVSTALLLTLLAPHLHQVAFTLAGFATAWGVASTRSNVWWGLMWGAGGAAVVLADTHFQRQIYEHEFFFVHQKVGLVLLVVPLALLLAVVPTVAGAPRLRALLGALAGTVAGTLLAVFTPGSVDEWLYRLGGGAAYLTSLVIYSSLLLAPLGALALGGRARLRSPYPGGPAAVVGYHPAPPF